ncbi:unnamed protein product [Amoebophrya sp. A120]|nr:unnamed protein product [Amoebophrya sp. A120]|eukprot:GSA120T00026003001.1
MSDADYVQDCRLLESGIRNVQNSAYNIHKELTIADSSSLLQTRSLIDASIAQIAELQTVLKRLRAYTQNANDVTEKASRKQMYQQLSMKLQAAAKDLENEIQQYINACNVQRSTSPSTSTGGIGAGNSNRQQAGSSTTTSHELIDMSSGGGAGGRAGGGSSSSSSGAGGLNLQNNYNQDPLIPTTSSNNAYNTTTGSSTSSSTASSSSRSNNVNNLPYGTIINQPQLSQFQQQAQKSFLGQEITDADLEQGRYERMVSVQTRMEDLQNLYTDLSDHVSRASEQFASIEAHVLRTAEMTHDAVNEIKITANRDFRQLFRRMMMGIVVFLFFLWNFFF